MPHLSKNQLKKKDRIQIERQLLDILNKRQKNKTAFFYELLTSTERLMLAKRLAIIFMVADGYSSYVIQKKLKVSVSTIRRISNSYHNESFGNIVSIIKKAKEREMFWQSLETILSAGLPPIAGRGRWKNFNKQKTP